jgi:hypothetical protein
VTLIRQAFRSNLDHVTVYGWPGIIIFLGIQIPFMIYFQDSEELEDNIEILVANI